MYLVPQRAAFGVLRIRPFRRSDQRDRGLSKAASSTDFLPQKNAGEVVSIPCSDFSFADAGSNVIRNGQDEFTVEDVDELREEDQSTVLDISSSAPVRGLVSD